MTAGRDQSTAPYSPGKTTDDSNITDLDVSNHDVQIHAESNKLFISFKHRSENYLLVYGLKAIGDVRFDGKSLSRSHTDDESGFNIRRLDDGSHQIDV